MTKNLTSLAQKAAASTNQSTLDTFAALTAVKGIKMFSPNILTESSINFLERQEKEFSNEPGNFKSLHRDDFTSSITTENTSTNSSKALEDFKRKSLSKYDANEKEIEEQKLRQNSFKTTEYTFNSNIASVTTLGLQFLALAMSNKNGNDFPLFAFFNPVNGDYLGTIFFSDVDQYKRPEGEARVLNCFPQKFGSDPNSLLTCVGYQKITYDPDPTAYKKIKLEVSTFTVFCSGKGEIENCGVKYNDPTFITEFLVPQDAVESDANLQFIKSDKGDLFLSFSSKWTSGNDITNIDELVISTDFQKPSHQIIDRSLYSFVPNPTVDPTQAQDTKGNSASISGNILTIRSITKSLEVTNTTQSTTTAEITTTPQPTSTTSGLVTTTPLEKITTTTEQLISTTPQPTSTKSDLVKTTPLEKITTATEQLISTTPTPVVPLIPITPIKTPRPSQIVIMMPAECEKDVPIGPILGGIFGGLGFFGLIAAIRRRAKKKNDSETKKELEEIKVQQDTDPNLTSIQRPVKNLSKERRSSSNTKNEVQTKTSFSSRKGVSRSRSQSQGPNSLSAISPNFSDNKNTTPHSDRRSSLLDSFGFFGGRKLSNIQTVNSEGEDNRDLEPTSPSSAADFSNAKNASFQSGGRRGSLASLTGFVLDSLSEIAVATRRRASQTSSGIALLARRASQTSSDIVGLARRASQTSLPNDGFSTRKRAGLDSEKTEQELNELNETEGTAFKKYIVTADFLKEVIPYASHAAQASSDVVVNPNLFELRMLKAITGRCTNARKPFEFYQQYDSLENDQKITTELFFEESKGTYIWGNIENRLKLMATNENNILAKAILKMAEINFQSALRLEKDLKKNFKSELVQSDQETKDVVSEKAQSVDKEHENKSQIVTDSTQNFETLQKQQPDTNLESTSEQIDKDESDLSFGLDKYKTGSIELSTPNQTSHQKNIVHDLTKDSSTKNDQGEEIEEDVSDKVSEDSENRFPNEGAGVYGADFIIEETKNNETSEVSLQLKDKEFETPNQATTPTACENVTKESRKCIPTACAIS